MITEVAAIGRVPSDKKGRYRTKAAAPQWQVRFF
ncbi:hypothetical protein SRABI64_02667 [Pseudomonas carnis]|uniref:Uncharacterized protein n=1 Tax=Pseudomonas fluorescens TaxID=294 RepID=A0A125QH42_PSEFL|nr:hypothetical protein PFL603g_01479 [Pseudomonas fluorescens]CAH0125550.1 hypothetical protein SRABI08_00064 [Pseudomonas carnis]CAH0197755.1 hypothetical protein SRABI110_01921 [Pseudomonas carnis]CAH0239006.1 hypothetical protein SRABI64_02667 [Pseudomonas carnis]